MFKIGDLVKHRSGWTGTITEINSNGLMFVRNSISEEVGEYNISWFTHVDSKKVTVCVSCKTETSIMWWKCCEKHTPENSQGVVCQECAEIMHPDSNELFRYTTDQAYIDTAIKAVKIACVHYKNRLFPDDDIGLHAAIIILERLKLEGFK